MRGQRYQNEWTVLVCLTISSLVVVGGCTTLNKPQAVTPCGTMTARYTKDPVEVDGILNDQAWKTAAAYQLSLGQDRLAQGNELAELGEVRLVWDDNHLYAGIKFYDSDIVAEGKEDQMHHYELGDVVELFLKPEDQTWYWELYATPRNKKTSFWLPERGNLTVGNCGLRVAAQCKGTLNNSKDRDRYWTAEMAIPIKNLIIADQQLAPGSKWRILVARYNYSRYLSAPELSMVPQISKTNYHLHEEYAVLDLAK